MKDNNVPVLSVIVPAYNAEKTLRRCLDSLLAQEVSSLEIIVSNDGSTDNTQRIIDEYVDTYPCISSVYAKNGGLSCARNRGIKMAKGMWITFVDSDDYVTPGIYDKIIAVLLAQTPDMLDYQYYVSIDNVDYKATPSSLPKDTILDESWISETILPVALNISAKKEYFIENYACNKIYKADIVHANGVLFDETRRKWEDRLFSLTFLQYAKTYYSMSEYGYHYVCGTGQSLSAKFEPDILRIIMDSYCKYLEMYGHRYDFNNPYTTTYFCRLLIDVAKDQFAYAVNPSALKNMLSIFVDNNHVKDLFANCAIEDTDMQDICTVIQHGNLDEIFDSLKRYATIMQRKNKTKQVLCRIRNLLSRVKQVLLRGN